MTDIARPKSQSGNRPERRAELEVLVEFWHYFSENRGAVIGL